MRLTTILGRSLAQVRLYNKIDNASKNTIICRQFSDGQQERKLYELRQYDMKPKAVKNVMKVLNEEMDSRLKHSKCAGYWLSELGGLNELIHIWEYDSLKHRAVVRKNLSEDAAFLKMIGGLFVNLKSMTNVVAVPMSWFPTYKDVEPTGVYSIENWVVADSTHSFEGVEKFYKHVESNYDAQLVCALRTVAGPIVNSGILLWKLNDIDTAVKIQCDSIKDSQLKVTTGEYKVSQKIMNSLLPFSPLK